jgi:hypothetical protein
VTGDHSRDLYKVGPRDECIMEHPEDSLKSRDLKPHETPTTIGLESINLRTCPTYPTPLVACKDNHERRGKFAISHRLSFGSACLSSKRVRNSTPTSTVVSYNSTRVPDSAKND